jgi:hypothetical protein
MQEQGLRHNERATGASGQRGAPIEAAMTIKAAVVDELSGKTFGNWTAIRRTDQAGRRTLCVCRCGIAREIATDALRLGLFSPSCGCSGLTTKTSPWTSSWTSRTSQTASRGFERVQKA